MKSPTILSTTFLLFLTTALFSGLAYADAEIQQKQKGLIIAGWLEGILFQPLNIKMRAKLDTGAETSSLHAVDIKRFKQDGKEWVKFRTKAHNKKAKLVSIEAPLVRDVKIKDHKHKAATRPVVEMTFCFHNQLFTSEFSLVDRSRFNYPVLLGRIMLQQGIIVDPSLTFTFQSDKNTCEKLMEIDQEQLAE